MKIKTTFKQIHFDSASSHGCDTGAKLTDQS